MNFKLVALALLATLISCAQKNHSTVERVPTAEEDPWTTWSRDKGSVGAMLVLRNIREDLLKNNIHDPHLNYSSYKSVECLEEKRNYRSADGTCYDLENPSIGAAGVAFGRNVAPEYIDKNAKQNLMTPNPSLVSKEFFTREEFKPVPFLNMLAASWIQFMNHDWLSHGKNEEKNPHAVHSNHRPEELVEKTKINAHDPSQYKKKFGKTTTNEVTHWWDGSQLYGSSQKEQDELRSYSFGKMRMVNIGNRKELLPKNENLNIKRNKLNQGYEVTGFRDNWWVGLSMLHHLFVKEHNAIADMLRKKYVKGEKDGIWTWDENKRKRKKKSKIKYFNRAELDEHIFQLSRLINAAVMAKIHTIEWTPAILDNKTLRNGMYANWYGLANPQTWSKFLKKLPGFNKTDWFSFTKGGNVVGGIVGDKRNNYGVPFSITEEFTSVYRLHSLLPESLSIRRYDSKDKIKEIKLADTRNEKSYGLMESYELKDLFYSFGTQHPGQIVLNNYPKFMQNLTIPGHGIMDLGMVDILRDRERGVPRYNQFRRAIGLKPVLSYWDFFPKDKPVTDRHRAIVEKFKTVYGVDEAGNDNVEMIDLLVGTLAEEVRPDGFGFGETQFQIFILMASRRLMADRFFTDDYNSEVYTKAGMKWIDNEGLFHKVITRHIPEVKSHFKGVKSGFAPWKK